jgi:hypothetical protein
MRYPDRMAAFSVSIYPGKAVDLRAVTAYTVICLMAIWFVLSSCSATRPGLSESGITGQVIWFEGNLMPGIYPGGEPAGAGGSPAQRQILIYELTHSREALPDGGPFYTRISTRQVAQAQSDPEGRFRVALSPGRYSVFTAEEEGYFCNISDVGGYLFPVEVSPGQYTDIRIEINYRAYY